MKTLLILITVFFCGCITVNKYYIIEPKKEPVVLRNNLGEIDAVPFMAYPNYKILPYNTIPLPTSPTAKKFCDSTWKIQGNKTSSITLHDCSKYRLQDFKFN